MTTDRIPAWARARAYPVALALIGVLIAYGVVQDEQASAWAYLAAALTGAASSALSTAYRPRTRAE